MHRSGPTLTASPSLQPRREGVEDATKPRHEHVTVEFWGVAASEGSLASLPDRLLLNITYKAVRVISDQYNLLYQVWSTNEHELYGLTVSFPLQICSDGLTTYGQPVVLCNCRPFTLRRIKRIQKKQRSLR